jgi:ketosteroid isomerase-like protein
MTVSDATSESAEQPFELDDVLLKTASAYDRCTASSRSERCAVPDTFRAEIDRLRSAYEAAVAAGDVSALTPLLEEGAVIVQPGAPEWAAMAASAPGLPFPPGARIAIHPLEVVELSSEWAYEFGTATTTYVPRGSRDETQLHDTYLVLFRNTGKGWKVYREVASSGPPPGGWPAD